MKPAEDMRRNQGLDGAQRHPFPPGYLCCCLSRVQLHSFTSHLLGTQRFSPSTLENASHPGVVPAFLAYVTSHLAHLPVIFPSPILGSSL